MWVGLYCLCWGLQLGTWVSASSESCFMAGGAVWLVVLPPAPLVDLGLDVNTHDL